MRRIFNLMLLIAIVLPVAVSAQKTDDSRYLEGAVPEVDGNVVFTKEFIVNGVSKDVVFDRMHKYLS